MSSIRRRCISTACFPSISQPRPRSRHIRFQPHYSHSDTTFPATARPHKLKTSHSDISRLRCYTPRMHFLRANNRFHSSERSSRRCFHIFSESQTHKVALRLHTPPVRRMICRTHRTHTGRAVPATPRSRISAKHPLNTPFPRLYTTFLWSDKFGRPRSRPDTPSGSIDRLRMTATHHPCTRRLPNTPRLLRNTHRPHRSRSHTPSKSIDPDGKCAAHHSCTSTHLPDSPRFLERTPCLPHYIHSGSHRSPIARPDTSSAFCPHSSRHHLYTLPPRGTRAHHTHSDTQSQAMLRPHNGLKYYSHSAFHQLHTQSLDQMHHCPSVLCDDSLPSSSLRTPNI